MNRKMATRTARDNTMNWPRLPSLEQLTRAAGDSDRTTYEEAPTKQTGTLEARRGEGW